jgi:hypothetical protein
MADYNFSRQFAYLKHHISDFTRRFFRCSESTKWVRMAFRHLETSIPRIQQCRFLRRQEIRFWALRAIRLFETTIPRHKTWLRQLRPCRIWPWIAKWVRMAFRHLETSLKRLHPSRFWISHEGRLWILRAFCLHKTLLQRICSNRFFEFTECRKCFRIAIQHHETKLHRNHQVEF